VGAFSLWPAGRGRRQCFNNTCSPATLFVKHSIIIIKKEKTKKKRTSQIDLIAPLHNSPSIVMHDTRGKQNVEP
jgi:hypothetical protein